MTSKELAAALRCNATVMDERTCDNCPFYQKEELPKYMTDTYPDDFLCSCDTDRIVLMAADGIEAQAREIEALRGQLEVERRPQWVSVSERLPKECENVLVLVSGMHNRTVFERSPMLGVWFGNRGWFVDEYPLWSSPGVTHWMPLPEAPKEDA